MLSKKIGYSYNDVTIVPSVISNVKSRSECDPYINGKLPIFASPMASVVSEENYSLFEQNGIIPILPRIKEYNIQHRIELMHKGWWIAVSLKEFENNIMNELQTLPEGSICNVCIDIANGHMNYLYDECALAKTLARKRGINLTIMTGNIANAKTYEWICKYGIYKYEDKNGYSYFDCAIDYIRVGIGGGSGCITTSNVSIHYPQASLINECKEIKESISTGQFLRKKPAIVADGGIRNYDHVIKALALGADYVMIGSVFAQCIESAGEKTTKALSQKLPLRFPFEKYRDFEVDAKANWSAYYNDKGIEEIIKPWVETLERSKKELDEQLYPHAESNYKFNKLKYEDKLTELKEKKILGNIDVKFFGMASADGQKSIDGEKKKTAEGITKWLPVKYTLSGWVENMISYLRSAMSYTDCKSVKDFIGKPELIVNSISEIQAVNK
jgi:IMP dehydrogenase/GMP reductase